MNMSRICGQWLASLALVVSFGLLPSAVDAKERDDGARERFYGWVEEMPAELHGTWVVGGRQVTTNQRTEFDQVEGPLRVGGCAKVELRGGAVHEIDSEPERNCR